MTAMRHLACLAVLLSFASLAPAAAPAYLWHEPEWFDGVDGSFAYWTGSAKPTGKWGVAGPGISAEWTQGGESEWNSMGAPAEETKASCQRDLIVPRAGKYRVWVRYVEHRKKKTPFKVVVESGGKPVATAELGVKPVLSPGDEYLLYWGFAFAWASFDAEIPKGPARLKLVIDTAGEAWRQVDAVLLTDDLKYQPHGREKPVFAYFKTADLRPKDGAKWRGSGLPSSWRRAELAGKDFSLWTGVDPSPKWWSAQKLDALTLLEVMHEFGPPPDVKKQFHKQYPKAGETPLIKSPLLLPGFYLGNAPDLSPNTALRKWLEKTKTPFYVLTNYAGPSYTDKTGPATYEALTGPLKDQFLGYVHGEAIGTTAVNLPAKPLGKTRAEHLEAFAKHVKAEQAKHWSAIYKTKVPQSHRSKSIPCLSVDSIALAHEFYEMGSDVVGYEEDSTNYHVPMRIAFQRGAARQYGRAWINYASGNFGDACNYFTQEPRVPRGAKSWYHSKYAVTDGVTACWYRKTYYLNYLGGASAIYWEQSLENQWILPGPGTHPIQLSPFGRGTEDFMDFVGRVKDRGEPVTPVAFLLSRAHGYEPVNYSCKMLHHFALSPADLELRELFNVAWYPAAVAEGKPASPDVQSLPSGVHGNVFDVLVDRSARSKAIYNYPVLWAAGDVNLGGDWPKVLDDYVKKGGTLVVNVEAAKGLPVSLIGVQATGKTAVAEKWHPDGEKELEAVPFDVALVERKGATVLAWADKEPLVTRNAVGKGAVIVTLVPRLLGQDERAHPLTPWLLNGLTDGLNPVSVRRGDGQPLSGELMYQVNKTAKGYLVLLVNNRGVDKTQNGVARVDRRKYVDALIRVGEPVKSARELTGPRELKATKNELTLRVAAGDVQVVEMTTGR
jgi:hypothetical protein